MARHRHGDIHDLSDDVQRTAAALGARTVIVMGAHGARSFGTPKRRRPSREAKLSAGGKFHIVNDPAHVEFARDAMRSDAADLDIITEREWPSVYRRFSLVTKDAGVPFPTRTQRRQENWGRWADAVREQIENASDDQVLTYFAVGSGIRNRADCPVCGA